MTGRTTFGHNSVSHDEWITEGKALFGDDTPMRLWRFVCPQCGHVMSGQMFMDLFESMGMDEDAANERATRATGRECIGRHTSDEGCDWCAYGLFRGPREVRMADDGDQDKSIWCFRFAEPDDSRAPRESD